MKDSQCKLNWYLEPHIFFNEHGASNDKIQASHPFYHDQGTLLSYVIDHCNGEQVDIWKAVFEGSIIHEGTLIECLSKCEEDANQEIEK